MSNIINMISYNFTCIDFRSAVDFGLSSSRKTRKERADAYRTDHFLAVDGFLAKTRFRQMRPAVWRQLPNPEIFLFRSFSLHDFRANHLSGKPQRYRNLPPCRAIQTLPYRFPREGFPEHPGQGKREKRLAYLCGLRPSFDPHRQEIVCQGRLWNRLGAGGLRIRFYHHRSLPFVVPLGAISQTQGRRQTAHIDRPARKYPLFYQHHRRKNPRRQYSRRVGIGAWRILCHGPRLYRFQPPVYLHAKLCLFRRSRQEQSQLLQKSLPACRQVYRRTQRSNDHSQELQNIQRISRYSPARQSLRCQTQKNTTSS